MTEKSKNDQKPKPPNGKIAAYTCGFLLLMSCLATSLGARVVGDRLKNGFGIGPGLSDFCTSFNGVHHDFDLAGRVVDAQGEPIQQAQVEIGSEGDKYCNEFTSYSGVTNESGEFSFGPDIFEYEKEFFISANADGCHTSVIYDDLASSEAVTIVLDCTPTSTP